MKELIKKYFGLNKNSMACEDWADDVAYKIEHLVSEYYVLPTERKLKYLEGYLDGIDDGNSYTTGNSSWFIVHLVDHDLRDWLEEVTKEE